MLCIKCKQEIPDISVYCMFCGKKQVSTSAAPVKKARNPNGTGTVFKRGRNASKASVAKHASPEEYRASTGFECLLGWLYLNGQLDRVHELFDTLWQQFDPNETR